MTVERITKKQALRAARAKLHLLADKTIEEAQLAIINRIAAIKTKAKQP